MARYCFYCGLELAPGERCRCQQAQKYEKDMHHTYESSSYSQSGTASYAQFSHPEGNNDIHAAKARSQNPGMKKKRRRLSTLMEQLQTLYPLIGQSILSNTLYFTRPATKIRQEAVRSKRGSTFGYLSLVAILTGLVCTLMLNSGTTVFSRLMTTLIGTGIYALSRHKWISFFLFAFAGLLWFFVLAAAFRICCAISRKKITYRRVLDLLSISLIYVAFIEILLLLSMFVGNTGALSLTATGICIMVMTNFFSMRNALGMSDDSTIFLSVFSYLLGVSCYRFAFPFFAQMLTNAL